MDKPTDNARDEALTTAEPVQGVSEPPAQAEPQPDRSATDTGVEPHRQGADDATPLLQWEESQSLCREWDSIQADFVDEPRGAVERADKVVETTLKRLAETFAAARANQETQWEGSDKASTEDLRLALQRYRSLLHRLLAV